MHFLIFFKNNFNERGAAQDIVTDDKERLEDKKDYYYNDEKYDLTTV